VSVSAAEIWCHWYSADY